MHINVNHQSQNIEAQTSIEGLLNQLQISSQGIAVAINNQIITKSQWTQTILNESDQVTIIQATQGG